MRWRFRQISDLAVSWAGHRVLPVALIALVVIWTAIGLNFSFPRRWFLLTNTLCTLTSFFVVLLLQHAQNRDTKALHTKLDELIRSSEAGNHWIAAEKKDADAIDAMRLQHQVQASEKQA
ncbi:low affinity iron permease family protein [Rhizobium bangladeshense]|uniref:low affinity iron permease family protein n=1 Tax=Rhizobium bangladeshense TaxID=1138189 RepID=UPI0007E5352B|nr:low affinity iron permease family protein [Rhizobium bangladeshense]